MENIRKLEIFSLFLFIFVLISVSVIPSEGINFSLIKYERIPNLKLNEDFNISVSLNGYNKSLIDSYSYFLTKKVPCIDYNFSYSNGDVPLGGFFVYAQNFPGIYYITKKHELSEFNFNTNRSYPLSGFPNLTYCYLNYKGTNYALMPYYNSSHVLEWLFSNGDENYGDNNMSVFAYNIINNSYYHYDFGFTVNNSQNYQISYIGNGNIISINETANSTGRYFIYNIYERKILNRGYIKYMETNNIYFLPCFQCLMDFSAQGSNVDDVALYKVENGSLNYVGNLNYFPGNYTVDGIPDLVVDISKDEVCANIQKNLMKYALKVVFQYKSGKFYLKYSSIEYLENGILFNPSNGYIPISTFNGWITPQITGYGDLPSVSYNPFQNITLVSEKPNFVNIRNNMSIGFNGAPVLTSSIYGINGSYYGAYFNLSNGKFFYFWKIGIIENYSKMLKLNVDKIQVSKKEDSSDFTFCPMIKAGSF